MQGLCDIHAAKADKANKIRYKVYTTNKLMDKEQKKYHNFYCSKDWIRTRDSVIAKCYGIDTVEYYRTGKVVQGFTVHHIVELSVDYEQRLDTDNLLYIGESNHQYIHREYNKGIREKKAMQTMLRGIKEKFIIEY